MWPFSRSNRANVPNVKKKNVGRAVVTVHASFPAENGTLQKKEYKVILDGYVLEGLDMYVEASSVFERWRDDGACGLLRVSSKEYVSLGYVNTVQVSFEDYEVEYEEE